MLIKKATQFAARKILKQTLYQQHSIKSPDLVIKNLHFKNFGKCELEECNQRVKNPISEPLLVINNILGFYGLD